MEYLIILYVVGLILFIKVLGRKDGSDEDILKKLDEIGKRHIKRINKKESND